MAGYGCPGDQDRCNAIAKASSVEQGTETFRQRI